MLAGRQGSHKRVRGEMDGRESPPKELRSQRHLVTKSDGFPRLQVLASLALAGCLGRTLMSTHPS